ncbi:hypothetical protein H323_24710, partial [Vibrio parahaemolyticus VP766]
RWLRQRDLSNQSFMDCDDIISKSAMHGIGFGLLPKSHQNVLEKMDRPDQLISQIGIIKVWKDLFSSDLQIQKSLSLST